MRILRTILRIPLLLLIFFVGSVTAYEVIRTVQNVSLHKLDWTFYGHATQGALELVVLVWLYRWLQPPNAGKASADDPASG